MESNPQSTLAQNAFLFDHATMRADDMVGMCEGQRLPTSPSHKVLSRWIHTGVQMPDGTRLKLPSFKRGGRRYTTAAAYLWWMGRQNEHRN